jgi:hypothetical protein
VNRLQTLVAAAGLAGLAVTSLPIAVDARALPKEIEQYLVGLAKFTATEVASFEAGQVIAKVTPGGADGEVVAVAAVKIRSPRKQVVAYYGQMVAYVDGQVTRAFGKFSNPPTMADVKDMSLAADEIAQLKSCKPKDCDLRIGGAAITKVRSAINWNGPDPAGQVNTMLRQLAVDYVAAYLKNGDAALITYDDTSSPVSLKQQWQELAQGSPFFQQYNPALRDYLAQFPAGKLPGTTDILYWINEQYGGLKPVLSITHGVVYDAPEQPDRTVILQKQLYASHYYEGSLALAVAIDAPDGTYLLYANRSRGDLLKGGFGGLKRRLAGDQARKAALQTLTNIKTVLEQQRAD